MRRIVKICSLSVDYKKEHDAWEAAGQNHKVYDGNANQYKYYADIKMQLLHCQDGLCAYTEKRLCPQNLYGSSNWNKGRYVKKGKDLSTAKGQLDHFTSTLKTNKGWLWDNFFVVDAEANNKKAGKTVHEGLKPDNPNYDPFDWLDYSVETHHFIPRRDLIACPEIYKLVEDMIDFLGISSFSEERRIYLADKLDDIKMGLKTAAQVSAIIEQFPTAFAFCLKKM